MISNVWRRFRAWRMAALLVVLAFGLWLHALPANAWAQLQTGIALAPRPLLPADQSYVSPPGVTFEWTATEGAGQYRLLIFREDRTSQEDMISVQVSGTSYIHHGLEPGYSYRWSVEADVPTGSYDQDFFEFTLSDEPLAPMMPAGVFASDGISRSEVEITWSSTYRTAYYLLQRRAVGSPDFVNLATVGRLGTYVDTQVEPEQRYQYRVFACNSVGCSPPSPVDEGWATSCEMSPAPPAPQLIAPQSGASFRFDRQSPEITLQWQGSPGARGYLLQLWDAETDNLLLREWIESTEGGEQSFAVFNLSGTFEWNVIALNLVAECANSQPSATWTYTAIRNPRPPVPLNVQASDGSFTDRVLVTWEQPENPFDDTFEGWSVLRATQSDPQAAEQVGRVHEAEPPVYTDNDVMPGTVYYYWITACTHANGCSDRSAPDSGYAGEGEAPVTLENPVFVPIISR